MRESSDLDYYGKNLSPDFFHILLKDSKWFFFNSDFQFCVLYNSVLEHNGGIIDEKAVKRVEKWNESMINREIELHSDIVEGYLETIEKFAKQVHEKTAYI